MSAVRPCTRADREGRLRKAEQFSTLAALALDITDGEDELNDAFVSNAVLAGIAAADVICCARLGRHSSSGSHNDAVHLLATTVDKDVSRDLSVLLGMKNRSGYSAQAATSADCLKAQRAVDRLMERARVAHAQG